MVLVTSLIPRTRGHPPLSRGRPQMPRSFREMKKYKKHHGYKHSGYGKTPNMDQDLSKPSFYERPDFHAYRARVEKVVLAAKEPVTTRYIHLALGDMAEPKWTLDSLETSTEIERIPGVVDKFAKKRERRITPPRFNDGLGDTHEAPRPY
jgi:hypothetical protein